MSPKTLSESRNGDGDDDDLLDFGSDGNGSIASEGEMDQRVGSDGGRQKRRKIIDDSYTTSFTGSSFDEMHRPTTSRVSPHLISAARLASSENGSPGTSPSASLRNLISSDQVTELSSADQLISLMTTNTYGKLPNSRSLSSPRLDGGAQTPKKVPLSVDIPVFGAKPQVPLETSLIPQTSVVTQPPDLGSLRNMGRTDYFQSRKSVQPGSSHFTDSSTSYISAGPLSPFRDILPSPSLLGKSSSGHHLPKMALFSKNYS